MKVDVLSVIAGQHVRAILSGQKVLFDISYAK